MAKSFWTLIGNDKYDIGLTGQTVYVYDKSGNELAKFKDLIYAYKCEISPNGDIFVVKTTEGRMASYSLEELKLIKKFRFSKIDGSQDDNFIFSPDGKYIYNIERHIQSYITALSIYNVEDFSLVKRLFLDEKDLLLSCIEYDSLTDNYYILGFYRNDSGFSKNFKYFVAKLINDKLDEFRCMNETKYTYYRGAKGLEENGYTKKAFEWSILNYKGYNLNDVKAKDNSLASLWKSINPNEEVEPIDEEENKKFADKLLNDMMNDALSDIDIDNVIDTKLGDKFKSEFAEILNTLQKKKK
jgi:hypothetical protein